MPEQYLDDLFLVEDGVEMPVDKPTWLTFDGRRYRLALTEAHRAELRNLLSRYTEAAKKAQRGRRKTSYPTISRADRARNARIRQWASRNEIYLAPAGPIPPSVREAYAQAQQHQSKPAPGETTAGPGEEGSST